MCGRILKKKYTVNSQPTSSSLLVKGSENTEGRGMSVSHGTGCFIGKEIGTEADPGKGPGGALASPYFQTKMRPEGPKKIFLRPAPPPLISGSG